jgi:hypothetical protein
VPEVGSHPFREVANTRGELRRLGLAGVSIGAPPPFVGVSYLVFCGSNP